MAVRHVRLSAPHAAVLFGTQALQNLLTMSSGLVASDGVVGVAGPAAELQRVRVLLPFVARSEVHLSTADAESIGLAAPGVVLDDGAGCTLHGPAGVVVLASAVVNAERVVLPVRSSDRVDVTVHCDRPRQWRRLGVVVGDSPSVFVVDDSGEVRRGTLATLG